MSNAGTRIPRFIGIVGCIAGLVCTPPVAGLVLALEPLHAEDVEPLWIFSATVIAVSAATAFGRFGGRSRIAALMMPLLMIFGVEVAARVWLKCLPPGDRNTMVLLARRTYRDTMAYQAHPFLQYTGRAKIALEDDRGIGSLPFNEIGFTGAHVPYEKPENTLRIICLGGSTTAKGYPRVMQKQMQNALRQSANVEVLNFGMSWYSSAHSVVNLVLNAVDYAPDYVVFHHAWNDERARNRENVRGDYSHAFKAFEYPVIADALLIRGSLIYRWLKDRLLGQPWWAFLDPATAKAGPVKPGIPYSDLTELWPYRRNVRTILDFALMRGITPIVVTQPHSHNPDFQWAYAAPHIDQCNEIVRSIVKDYGDKIVFVDLDKMMTGKMEELFYDLGHMIPKGIEFKARAIGNAIRAHRGKR